MNIEKQIEFDKLKHIWMEHAVTDAAKERIAGADIFLDEGVLRKELRDTTDSREMVDKLGNPPIQDVTEIKQILESAKKGDCLNPYQLERIKSVLIIIERLRDYLARGKAFNNSIAYYDENMNVEDILRDEIERQIRGERVDDYATKELHELRDSIVNCEDRMKQKAEQIMRSNKDAMADSFFTTRNGRVCVPVKRECKFKILGSVIDKSTTGNTIFVEPIGVAKYYEELQILLIDEENEVYKILYTLTAMVADVAEEMYENIGMIEKLDYIFSKGKLSLDMDCCEPRINLERRIVLDGARHPLMDKNISVPLQFRLGETERGVVITGPNTGGKTVAIKTVMLNCIMAQCGLHVTSRYADICMNTEYLCDIGDGQNLSENLSTFSAHIKNVLDILGEVGANSFVIMDELGSGTDPAEGMGIAVAILEKLRESGANFLVTTHYPEVKDYANEADGITNARMTFDKVDLKPTYQMVIGEAGESCAFYIASRLGMPKEMLEFAAKRAYGSDFKVIVGEDCNNNIFEKKKGGKKLTKHKKNHIDSSVTQLYQIGDSVMVFPDKKIGIVCEPVNEKGVLRVQIATRKIWINHKRVKLHVKASELYPEDYDFSIIFDDVKSRKLRHDMERKLTEETLEYDEE